MKKSVESLVAAALLSSVVLAGCASTAPSATATPAEKTGGKEILLVSFGTSFAETREADIGGIERAVAAAYPDWKTERAFTAQTIIKKLQSRDGITVHSLDSALEAAATEGISELVVQPTHLMNGLEYDEIVAAVESHAGSFGSVKIGSPLLTSDEDFAAVADAIARATDSYLDGQTAVCLMGHGTEAASNAVYTKLQTVFAERGYADYFVGTVEASPSVEDLIAQLAEKGGYTRVVLEPLMVVAGDHATNDMAGDDDDSWKNQFLAAGYEVECILEGLGRNSAVQDVYIRHVSSAVSAE